MKRKIKRVRGYTIQFISYSEIRNLSSDERIKKILSIILGGHIIIVQGRLKPDEETRLIGDTMAMIGHVKNFKGVELAVVEGNDEGVYGNIRQGLANAI